MSKAKKRFIDANALKKAIDHTGVDMLESADYFGFTYKKIMRVIDDAPTADVAPVVNGHYITDCLGDSSCSVCGETDLNITKNYCPQCGALLDGKDNEDG